MSSVADFKHFSGLGHVVGKFKVWTCFWPIHSGSELEGTLFGLLNENSKLAWGFLIVGARAYCEYCGWEESTSYQLGWLKPNQYCDIAPSNGSRSWSFHASSVTLAG